MGLRWDQQRGGFFWERPTTTVPASPSPYPQQQTPAPTGADTFRDDWYNQPGVTFNGAGQAWDPVAGVYRSVNVPAWMPDPQSFYPLYQQTSPDYRSAMLLNLQSRYADEQNALAGQTAGRNWLGGQMGDVRAGADSWAADPTRALVTESLTERASPEHEYFTPVQRTAAGLPLGQQYATNTMLMGADAARRGAPSGIELQNNAIARGQAMTGGAVVQSAMDTASEQLRSQALGALASTTGAYEGVDLAYTNASNQLAGALAALEMGVDFEPADYTVWPTLDLAQDEARREASFRQQGLAAMEEESRSGIQELLEMLISGKNAGIFDLFV